MFYDAMEGQGRKFRFSFEPSFLLDSEELNPTGWTEPIILIFFLDENLIVRVHANAATVVFVVAGVGVG